MRALTLKDLPPPPEGRAGWPWTEESRKLPDLMPDGKPWPKISIVTPNYNYGQFIEETIRSVLLQGYPNLEYIIIDGGSTDDSVGIIRKYEKFLAYFMARPDRGVTQSINEGFLRSTGDIFAWINSDDIYFKNVFSYVATKYMESDPKRFWLVMAVDYFNPDVNVSCVRTQNPAPSVIDWTIGETYPNQQGAFWARRIWEKEGALDESLQHEFDLEFFVRLIARGYNFTVSNETAARFRWHSMSKTRYQSLYCRHDHALIALKYLPKDYYNYNGEKKRLLGLLTHYNRRLSQDTKRPLSRRALDLARAFYYKLRTFF